MFMSSVYLTVPLVISIVLYVNLYKSLEPILLVPLHSQGVLV